MELGIFGLGRMGIHKVLSAQRYEFGGHEEEAAAKKGGA